MTVALWCTCPPSPSTKGELFSMSMLIWYLSLLLVLFLHYYTVRRIRENERHDVKWDAKLIVCKATRISVWVTYLSDTLTDVNSLAIELAHLEQDLVHLTDLYTRLNQDPNYNVKERTLHSKNLYNTPVESINENKYFLHEI
jgi:hypothetical protein